MKKFTKYSLISIAILTITYLIGPKLYSDPIQRELPKIDCTIDTIEDYVKDKESKFNTRNDCEGAIVWADSTKRESEYVLLYLHGFSASKDEGSPITYDVMSHFGMNGYLARLESHGLNDDNALLNMTPNALYKSAQEALVIASKLGKKVIVMGCSTGCTLSLMLAADYPDMVDALILYSPNIRIRQWYATLLSKPWGLQLSRLVYGGNYSITKEDSSEKGIWDNIYRLEAQIYLQQLLDESMNEDTFKKVTQPLFMGYYYKNTEEQDPTISVKAALWMFDNISTTKTEKEAVCFPKAGVHVINNGIKSNSINDVRKATFEFIEQKIIR